MKFNLSTILKTELIFKADLRVYLEVDHAPSSDNVNVSLLFLNGSRMIKEDLAIPLSHSQWLEFKVASAIDYWLRTSMLTIQGFKIQLKSNSENKCGESYHIKTKETVDFLPLLTVYSYETNESKSSFIQGVEKAMEQTSEQTQNQSTGIRVTRSTEPCGMKSLTITRQWLNQNIFPPDETIVGPSEIIINLCEGSCTGAPLKSEYSSLLYLLKQKNHSGFRNSTEYSQRCLPIAFNSTIVVLKTKDTYVIENIGKISVALCSCAYVHKP